MDYCSDDPEATLLDDFVDASFSYRHVPEPHSSPWVGIFHHPARVHSPLASDRSSVVTRLQRDRMFRQSVRHLKGAVCLCPQLEPVLREWLGVPVLVTHHPTETDVTQFDITQFDATERPPLFQCGFFLRDTRFVYHLDVPRYEKARSRPYTEWAVRRDAQLKYALARGGPPQSSAEVREFDRLPDHKYDEVMASSIVVTRLFGAAANNVVVESLARNSPLLVNRLPEVEYYLGSGYPLFFRDHDHAQQLLRDWSRVEAAHQYMAEFEAPWLDAAVFAAEVADFVRRVA
jgi:hypothetical protein